MIDFEKASVFKLAPCNPRDIAHLGKMIASYVL
ncbi:hypothetical protein JOF56_010734 [Kibdelosporangium banguiense]|uniref:GNAT family N-acetyltransferase n=1 Tax=Kibdelosporangium banguiense TaxID=1365924 RepID=A0ABS4U115_9PSEU|nr:hypothetical protein [Kibdelosporangium banguiense]